MRRRSPASELSGLERAGNAVDNVEACRALCSVTSSCRAGRELSSLTALDAQAHGVRGFSVEVCVEDEVCRGVSRSVELSCRLAES